MVGSSRVVILHDQLAPVSFYDYERVDDPLRLMACSVR